MLDNLGIEYHYIDVDKEEGDEREIAKNELKNWNPDLTFPTVVINNEKCIIGFKEEEIKKVLGL